MCDGVLLSTLHLTFPIAFFFPAFPFICYLSCLHHPSSSSLNFISFVPSSSPPRLLLRARHQVMCNNLIRLTTNLTAGEHASLEQLVALMVSNKTIPPAVIALLWDTFTQKVRATHINNLYSGLYYICTAV